jgi:hypothetical protein
VRIEGGERERVERGLREGGERVESRERVSNTKYKTLSKH